MATVIFPFVAVDGNGNVRASAKLYFYQTGTSTPQATYSDSALSVTNANPVVANSDGLFTGIYLGEAPTFTAYKAVLKDSNDVTIWTQDPIAGAPIAAPISASILRGYISGLERTGSTGTTYSSGAGVAADDTNAVMLSMVSGTINCATVGADGLDAGALAVTTSYHVFAIGKTDGTTARLASTSPSSPIMPSGYTYKRRTQSFKTTVSSQIIGYDQRGDNFMLSAVVLEFALTGAGTTAVTRTLTGVPSGIVVEPVMSVNLDIAAGGSGEQIYLSSLSQPDATADSTTSQVAVSQSTNVVTLNGMVNGVFTDTSARIRTRQAQGGTAQLVRLKTHGWVDPRGKDG